VYFFERKSPKVLARFDKCLFEGPLAQIGEFEMKAAWCRSGEERFQGQQCQWIAADIFQIKQNKA
jgi:hypothetical protein